MISSFGLFQFSLLNANNVKVSICLTNAALIIVSGIHLDRSKDPPLPSLGKVKEIYNWQIENHNLEPINFYYTIDK